MCGDNVPGRMNRNRLKFLSLAVVMIASNSLAQPKASPDRLRAFRKEAAKFKSVVSLPQFELTTNEVRGAVRQTIAVGNAALDVIAALKPGKVTFENTLR